MIPRRGFLKSLASFAALPYIEPIIRRTPILRKYKTTSIMTGGGETLTGIPPAPVGVITRNIYRSKVGSDTYELIATITDNTTFPDTIPDTKEDL